MEEKNEKNVCCGCEGKGKCKGGGGFCGGGIYGLGFIGALVFYIQNAETFWIGVLGFLKAIFWPVFLVYKLLAFLQ